MEWNERVAAARKAAGLTQEALGEKLGVSRQAVSKWESGQAVPDLDTVAKLCLALGFSADYLLFGREDAPAPAESSSPASAPPGRTWPGTSSSSAASPTPTPGSWCASWRTARITEWYSAGTCRTAPPSSWPST